MKTDDLRPEIEIDDFDNEKYDQEFECYMTEPAEMADLDELCELDPDPARRAVIEKAIREKHCWLVADSKRVLAYGIYDHSFKSQRIVKWVHIHPDYRRQGVAADMLMGFEATCESRNIYAAVPRNNLAAQELVKSVGYAPVPGEALRGPQDDPQVIYVKDIWAPMPMMTPDTVQ